MTLRLNAGATVFNLNFSQFDLTITFHVRGVLAGEIVYEPDTGDFPSPLAGFSFNSHAREIYSATHMIEPDFTILEINLK